MPILAAQPRKFIDDSLFSVALRVERENHPNGGSLFFVDNVCTLCVVAVIADDVATAVKDTFLPTDFLTGENALRNLAAFLLCHRCHDGKTKLAITVHCPNVVRYKENFNAEIAKFAGKLKGIDSVAGKAADLTGDDQVEFATFGIGKHFHEGRALFGGGSGDALVDILCLL